MKMKILNFLREAFFYTKLVLTFVGYTLSLSSRMILLFSPTKIYEVKAFSLKRVKPEDLSNYKVSSIKTNTTNAKPFSDLLEMAILSRTNKTSQAGQRVVLKKNVFESNITFNEKSGMFEGDAKISYLALDKDGNELLSYDLNMDGYSAPIPVEQNYVEALLQVAFSGIYSTPHDFDALLELIAEYNHKVRENPYCCEECDGRFHDAKEFNKHLDETGHYDSFFDEFPYDPELLEIRKKYNHVLKGDKK